MSIVKKEIRKRDKKQITSKAIVEGNICIAKFMRIKISKEDIIEKVLCKDPAFICQGFKTKALSYHRDWNWTMYAFDKLRLWPKVGDKGKFNTGELLIDQLDMTRSSIFIGVFIWTKNGWTKQTIFNTFVLGDKEVSNCNSYQQVFWKTIVDFASVYSIYNKLK